MLLRDYFNSLNFHKNGELSRTKLVGVAYKLREKMKNSRSSVDVLHKILNVVIARCCFAEGGKEMYQNAKRTCRAIVFAHETYCFAALLMPLPSSLLRGCLHGGRKILTPGRSEKAEKLFVCFTCRNFGRSGYQVEKEKKNNCRP